MTCSWEEVRKQVIEGKGGEVHTTPQVRNIIYR